MFLIEKSRMTASSLSLRFGFSFADFYDRDGLVRMDATFIEFVREADTTLANSLVAARQSPAALPAKEESELLIALAPHLEDFLGQLFGIESELHALAAQHHELARLGQSGPGRMR